LSRLRNSRLACDRVEELAEELITSAGGKERLLKLLGPVETAKLGVWLAQHSAERQMQLDEQIRREEEARASLSDPGMREACVQLLLEEVWRWPSRATRAAASICPREAYDSLKDVCLEKLAEWLIADGWTPPPDAAQPTAAHD
jgi:hypothetical protein